MSAGFSHRVFFSKSCSFVLIALFASCIELTSHLFCQTASTGALTGVTLDSSGALLPQVSIKVVKEDGNEVRVTNSDEEGRFGVLFLSPGSYRLKANKIDFEPRHFSDLRISVTETLRVELRLHPAMHFESVDVFSAGTERGGVTSDFR